VVSILKSGLRGVDDVAWPVARRKQQHVNSMQITCPNEPRRHRFGSADYPAQAIIVDRKVQISGSLTPFNFDKADGPSAPHNQVDLSARSLDPPGKDAPTLEPKIPGRQLFAPAALLFPVLAVYHLSSIARA
jgi:hypothetical protein